MNPSKEFKDAIQKFLDGAAKKDNLFAEKLKNKNKCIEECCNFIASEVSKMKVHMLSDDEVFGLAMHYYDEEKVSISKVNYSVVATVVAETPEENAPVVEMKPKKSRKKFTEKEIEEFEKRQLSLF